ncbi:MAG: RsmB/NOP family class I SAM-dependent RNA methyltransferase, partial [Spirochaetes bacterium]|nr:RsmB/NOP family class I SAM-dependent RNA methyltransferase [Spirochaetota bacterium]
LVEIQDLASQLLGEAVDAHPGMAVWDVCAGGGGKTMQIAAQMQNRGVLYASDIRDYKLDELKLRARRGGFHNVRRFVYDAESSPRLTKEIENSGGFHRILVDAPCSASGTLRRNPDVRYRIMPGDPEKFAAVQLKILSAVAPHLKAGGKLVYATCSVFRRENEAVVEKFLLGQSSYSLSEAQCVGSPQLDADTMFFAVLVKK